MYRLTIAIDIDDVLSDNASGFVKFSNERWGTRLSVDDYDEDWAKMWEIDHSEAAERSAVFHAGRFILSYNRIEGAREVLLGLKEKYNLCILSSRRNVLFDDTLDWLDRYYRGIFDRKNVYFAGIWEKDHTTDIDAMIRATKADKVDELGADILIDDQLKHCIAVAEQGGQAILFGDYPWNQTDKLPENVVRCHGWDEVEAAIEKIEVHLSRVASLGE